MRKIDIVEWNKEIDKFIANALSPAKVKAVFINETEKSARVIVDDSQLSLAIGKEGQNVRLAAKLTNWKIDIKSDKDQDAYNMDHLTLIPDKSVLKAAKAGLDEVTEAAAPIQTMEAVSSG